MTQHKKRNRGPAAAIAGSVTLLAAGVVTSVLVASVPPPGAAGTSAGVTVLAHHGKAQHREKGFGNPLAPLTANPDCTLTVPANPLSAQGLATPYELGSAGQQCSEANQNLAAFVQATILDPATGALSVYNPVVKDAGQPLLGTPPPVPVLPPRAVIAIWTGFNGNVLKLTGPGAGGFANFAQQSYDNSPLFFFAVSQSIRAGRTAVPPLRTGTDGMTCPSPRDFSVVDQDQSDNVPVTYPAYGVTNGSDEALIDLVNTSLGCTTWQVPSLSAGGTSPSGLLQEVQAARFQQAPVALVPGLDPFVTLNAQPDLFFQDLYRLQVGQPLTFNDHDTKAYCLNLMNTGEPRLKADAVIEAGFPAPAFAQIGTNLANVLAARFSATWTNLTCPALTGQPSPITVTFDPVTGLATSAVYGAAPAPAPSVTTTTPAPRVTTTTPAPEAPTTTPAPDVTTTTPAPDVTTTTSAPA